MSDIQYYPTYPAGKHVNQKRADISRLRVIGLDFYPPGGYPNDILVAVDTKDGNTYHILYTRRTTAG